MKMAEVCAVFEKQGMKNVSSVLASGNILFVSDKQANELRVLMEKAMSARFGYEAFLFVKNENEIATIVSRNPFEAHPDFHIYCFVGADAVEKTLLLEFEKSTRLAGEEAQIVGNNFYWKTPKGSTLDSGFGKILGRKNLKNVFTSRNLNTFEKVLKKM